jgi:HlyD family secretion protein
MKKRIVSLTVLLAVGGAAIAWMTHAQPKNQASPAQAPAAEPNPVCAPGKIEPLSEEIQIGSQLSGVLLSVPVDEGQHVRKGQTIAVLDNRDYAARVEEARATVEVRRAELDRIVNGARDQERREAAAAVEEARAVLANARAEKQRQEALFTTGDISRSDWERAEREFQVAEARVAQTAQHASFIDAPAREDERARAQASLALAQAQLAESQALLEKTIVRAPIDGVILKRFRKGGETVSDKGDTPIVAFGDDSRLRVRVDVDETDVAHLRLGQRAWFTAPAFGTQKFWGRVVRIGGELGKKNIQTSDPAEKVDTKVLETLVELDGHPPLPSGLRVDSFILAGETSKEQR